MSQVGSILTFSWGRGLYSPSTARAAYQDRTNRLRINRHRCEYGWSSRIGTSVPAEEATRAARRAGEWFAEGEALSYRAFRTRTQACNFALAGLFLGTVAFILTLSWISLYELLWGDIVTLRAISGGILLLPWMASVFLHIRANDAEMQFERHLVDWER